MRAAVFALFAACGGGDDAPPSTDPPQDDWPGAVVWTWMFSDGGPCPDGVTKVNVYVASWDIVPYTVRLEPELVNVAACSAGGVGFLLGNPFGVGRLGHDTWIELVTADNRVYATSHVINTKTKNATPAVVIEVPRGWVHAAWTLFGETSQMPLACDDVPSLRASGEGAVLLYDSTESDIVLAPSRVSCATGETWLALPAGTHDVSLGAFRSLELLVNDQNHAYRLGNSTFAAQTITAGATLELGTQQIRLVEY